MTLHFDCNLGPERGHGNARTQGPHLPYRLRSPSRKACIGNRFNPHAKMA